MSVLRGVLEEELKRNLRNQKNYQEKLANLPKGSIYISERNGKKYLYRKNRIGKKIVNEYVCSFSDAEKANLEIEKSKEYSRILENLRVAQMEELKLRKALKVYED